MAAFLPALTKRKEGDKGRILVAPIRDRINLWVVFGVKHGFPLTAKCAERLLGMHITSGASERNWSDWGHLYTKYRARMSLKLGEKLIFIRANMKSAGGSGMDEEIAI